MESPIGRVWTTIAKVLIITDKVLTTIARAWWAPIRKWIFTCQKISVFRGKHFKTRPKIIAMFLADFNTPLRLEPVGKALPWKKILPALENKTHILQKIRIWITPKKKTHNKKI